MGKKKIRILEPDHVGDYSFPLAPSITVSGATGRKTTQVDSANCI